jgi:hypothetical protein
MLEASYPLRSAALRAFPAISLENILRVFLVLAFIHALGVLAVGINQPLLDVHAWRQTQTALTAYWLLRGGPWLAYQTPVLGAPWSVPFEFPVYQLITAAVSAIGIPLEAAGRLVAFGFFLGSLWPLRILFDELKLGQVSYFATAILFLTCPLYLFWSRTFLIETCALFFAVLWLAFLVRYLNRRVWTAVAGALAAGCLAILAKSTTLPGFTVLGSAIAAVVLGRDWFVSERKGNLMDLAVVAAVIALPYLVGLAWTSYSDAIKMTNEFGRLLTTRAEWAYYFGDLNQRRAHLWFATVHVRVIPEILGSFSLLGIAALGATLTSRRTLIAATGALVGFVVPFLVFTNVHIIHGYYQAANAIFLVAAVGLGIGRIYDGGQRSVAVLLLAAIVASQLLLFHHSFFPLLISDYSNNRLLRIAQIARDATPPGQSLIVIGDDWASTVPYYAERKGLVLDRALPLPLMQRVLAEPQRYLGDAPLGGVVYCIDKLPTYGASIPAIQAFIAGRVVVGEFGGCQLLGTRP